MLLRLADLSGALLYSADLSEADLTLADLSRTQETMGANFSGAYLMSADLRDAHFVESNFTGADLTDALVGVHTILNGLGARGRGAQPRCPHRRPAQQPGRRGEGRQQALRDTDTDTDTEPDALTGGGVQTAPGYGTFAAGFRRPTPTLTAAARWSRWSKY